MVGRSRSHSEERWALLPETVIRCNATRPNGSRCKREAADGGVVCDQHGGAAPQVRRRAAERLIMSADHVSQKLLGGWTTRRCRTACVPRSPKTSSTAQV